MRSATLARKREVNNLLVFYCRILLLLGVILPHFMTYQITTPEDESRINVSLPQPLLKSLHRLANDNGMGFDEACRDAVEEGLKALRPPTP